MIYQIVKRSITISIISVLLLVHVACNKEKITHEYFPGKYPGKVTSNLSRTQLALSNNALQAIWDIKDHSIVLNQLSNKYDNTTVDLSQIVLFAIELEDGRQLTNRNFFIQGKPVKTDIASTDSLSVKSLRFAGKEISVSMNEKSGNISIKWKAQLRDGSNYIRQNIEIKTNKDPVKISRITFFDGTLTGAKIAGLVLGSPIKYRNFFFGLEHPIAHSKALMTRNIGNITPDPIDVSDIIDSPGEYIVSAEQWYPLGKYNIESIALYENENLVAIDKHPLNGVNGNDIYRLRLNNYSVNTKYQVNAEIVNISDSSIIFSLGAFHMYRKTSDILNFYIDREDELNPGTSISEWSVMGVAPPSQKRRAFLYYLERERARPYKQFLHYNCWWDITSDGLPSFTSEQLIERMHAWNNKFIEPFNVHLQSFVFDDGWDDLDSVWFFDPVKFPNGFKPQAELCKKYNSGIGVWMSPFGGYGKNKVKRIMSAHREGLETNDGGLSLSGKNYYNRFLDRALDMLNNYKVNYFKFDGFGGSEPKFLPDMEAGTRLISTLRKHNPDVFINITVGSWPSPFWLKYADCTWRGSADIHMIGEGSNTQQFMTYRDGMLHNNIVEKSPYYPLNSIMTVGIVYANLGYPTQCINDNIDDFKNMVWSFFGAGSSLQELYISHDRMKPEFWSILAKAAKWSKENEDILKDTHWIGGSPINLETYGFASWSPQKGIITLRNPTEKISSFVINLNKILELPPKYSGKYSLIKIYSGKTDILEIQDNENIEIQLKPFETRIYEVKKSL